jgi:hypothetical protein
MVGLTTTLLPSLAPVWYQPRKPRRGGGCRTPGITSLEWMRVRRQVPSGPPTPAPPAARLMIRGLTRHDAASIWRSPCAPCQCSSSAGALRGRPFTPLDHSMAPALGCGIQAQHQLVVPREVLEGDLRQAYPQLKGTAQQLGCSLL